MVCMDWEQCELENEEKADVRTAEEHLDYLQTALPRLCVKYCRNFNANPNAHLMNLL